MRYIFLVLGEGVILHTAAWAGLVSIAAALHVLGPKRPPDAPSVSQVVMLASVVGLPLVASIWWVFRRLKSRCSGREARAVTVSFSVVTLLSWLIAIPLAQIPGAYMANLSWPLWTVGVFASIAIFIAMANLAVSSIVLWIVRRASA